MSTFYMTWNRDQPHVIIPWIEEHNVPIMTNAMNRWSTHTHRFNKMYEYDTRRIVDSGGYNMQAKYADRWGNLRVGVGEVVAELETECPFFYWDVEDYHEWLADYEDRFDWAAVMDYACEERFDALWSLEERMEATIENTVRHFELLEESDASYELVPVLQGTTVDEWEWSYRQLQDADVDIPLDTVGIGSVCRKSSQKELVEIESELRDRLEETEHLHGFGVKVQAFKHGASFDSADSFAWSYTPSKGGVQSLHTDGKHLINVHGAHQDMGMEWSECFDHTFKSYYAHAATIVEGEKRIDRKELYDEKREYGITDQMCNNKQ